MTRPVSVGYLRSDPYNRERMLDVLVSVDGQRMTVREAVALGLMVMTPNGGYAFDYMRCCALADTLVDTLTGRRRLQQQPATPAPKQSEYDGLHPRTH